MGGSWRRLLQGGVTGFSRTPLVSISHLGGGCNPVTLLVLDTSKGGSSSHIPTHPKIIN